MSTTHIPIHRRFSTRLLAAAFAVSAGLVTVGAQSAAATALVPVPAGCGPYSGLLVPADQLDDHSTDTAPWAASPCHTR